MSYVLGSSATNLQNKKQNAINLTEKLSKRLHFCYLWRITLHSSAPNTFNHSFPIEQQLCFSIIIGKQEGRFSLACVKDGVVLSNIQ